MEATFENYNKSKQNFIFSNSFDMDESCALRKELGQRPSLFYELYSELLKNVHIEAPCNGGAGEMSHSESRFESQLFHSVHRWTIDNFSFYWNWNDNKADYPYISSAQFGLPLCDKVQFQLRLFPRGCMEENKNFVSVYVDVITRDSDTKARMRIKLALINAKGERCNREESKTIKTKGWESWSSTKFVSLGVLKDQTKGLLPKDCLTLICEVGAELNTNLHSYNQFSSIDQLPG